MSCNFYGITRQFESFHHVTYTTLRRKMTQTNIATRYELCL